MKNKELKKQILETKVKVKFEDGEMKDIELFKEYSHMRYRMYCAGLDKETIKINMIDHYGEEMATALEQMSNARIKQKAKIKQHLEYLLNSKYECYFITLTIRDDVLNSRSEENLHKRMIRAFDGCDDFIFNKDYAPETGRLHGHGIAAFFWAESGLVVPAKEYYESIGQSEAAAMIKSKRTVVIKTPAMLNYMKNTGFVYCQPVKNMDSDKNKLPEYIAKLTAHSIKVKQSYVSTRKNSTYQKFMGVIEDAKKTNRKDCLREGRYIPLQHTICSDPLLTTRLNRIGELNGIPTITLDEFFNNEFLKEDSFSEKGRKKSIKQLLAESREIELPVDNSPRTVVSGIHIPKSVKQEDIEDYLYGDYEFETVKTEWGFTTKKSKKNKKS